MGTGSEASRCLSPFPAQRATSPEETGIGTGRVRPEASPRFLGRRGVHNNLGTIRVGFAIEDLQNIREFPGYREQTADDLALLE